MSQRVGVDRSTMTRCPHCGLRGCPCVAGLIEQWRHLPLALAGDLAHGDDETFDELVSVGNLALCKAAISWTPDPRGFKTYAWRTIRWAMLDELRRRGRYTQKQVQVLMLARMAQRSGAYCIDPTRAQEEELASV